MSATARGHRPGRRGGRADRVVRPVGRCADRDEQRQREPGLGRPRAAAPRGVHARRRRGEHRRGRHQRRRPAVLERRGDDAHAHPRHPRHDTRRRHGAHRQAGPRLRRRRVGRGQPRASAATSASWARTVRRSTGRRTSPRPAPILLAHYEHAYVAPGERFPRRRPPPIPPTATYGPTRTSWRTSPSRRSATSSPTTRTGSARSRSTSAPSCGRRSTATTRRSSGGRGWTTPTRPSCSTPTSAATRSPCSASSHAPDRGGACSPRTVPASGRPARCSRCRRRRWPGRSTRPAATDPSSSWPTSPGSTARQSRCGGCSWSTAPRSVGPSSASTGPSCSASCRATTVARSWCSRPRSTTTWRCSPSRDRSRR